MILKLINFLNRKLNSEKLMNQFAGPKGNAKAGISGFFNPLMTLVNYVTINGEIQQNLVNLTKRASEIVSPVFQKLTNPDASMAVNNGGSSAFGTTTPITIAMDKSLLIEYNAKMLEEKFGDDKRYHNEEGVFSIEVFKQQFKEKIIRYSELHQTLINLYEAA